MTKDRKSSAVEKVVQLGCLLNTAVVQKIADDVHYKRKGVSVANRLNHLRAKGWTIDAIKAAFARSEPLLDFPLAAAADLGMTAESTVSLEPYRHIWINSEHYELWLLVRPSQKLFLLKLGSVAKPAVVLCTVRYELNETEYPGMFAIDGLTLGDIDEIIDTHSSPERSGQFE
jgi:hypothetical protein